MVFRVIVATWLGFGNDQQHESVDGIGEDTEAGIFWVHRQMRTRESLEKTSLQSSLPRSRTRGKRWWFDNITSRGQARRSARKISIGGPD